MRFFHLLGRMELLRTNPSAPAVPERLEKLAHRLRERHRDDLARKPRGQWVSQCKHMPARLVNIDYDSPLFLPPNLRDWVTAGHMAHFIVEGRPGDGFAASPG
jgi:hypothetical protein